MHKTLPLACTLLAACSTAPADPPAHGVTPGHKCEMEGTDQFIGQTRSGKIENAIKRVSHAAIVRWAPPGVMMTMDYREDRVTVYLDASNKIIRINCG